MFSWGQLRLFLQQFAPGRSPDEIDGYLNARYQHILDHVSWKGAEVEGTLETTPAYSVGTVSATLGSPVIFGSGTNWNPALSGLRFQIPGAQVAQGSLIFQPQSAPLYTATIADAHTLQLDRPFEGQTAIGAGYWLMQNIYSLPQDCRTLISVLSPLNALPLREMSSSEMDQYAGLRSPGWPTSYAVRTESTAISSPNQFSPVMHRIELFPVPMLARGYPIRYLATAYGFDGTNTSAFPPTWMSDSVLLNGCKADLRRAAGDVAGANDYEEQFTEGLMIMARAEQRRTSNRPPILPESAYRHRVMRVLR